MDQFLAIFHVRPSIFPFKIIQLFQLIHVRLLTDYLWKILMQKLAKRFREIYIYQSV